MSDTFRREDFSKLKASIRLCSILLLFSISSLLFPGGKREEEIDLPGNRGGFRYFKNYTPEDYNLQPQNWCVLQDKQGVIYIANNAGLLVFDGVSWDGVEIPDYSVRSLTLDQSNTIYIGGNNEIGYLTRNANGSLHYTSLLNQIDKDKRNFGNVWKCHTTAEGIYFFTSKYLFRWNPRQKIMHEWEPDPGFQFDDTFTCDGKLFVHLRGLGLKQLEENQLHLVAGGEAFASSSIYMMAPFDDQKILIGCRADGFYLYDGREAVPFPTEADDYIKENQLYHGIRLSSSPGQFAMATRRGGLVIIDSDGKVKDIFNTSSGLQVNNVKYVFEDRQGNLWLALVKGISKIEYASPFSIYDDRSNLPELVLSVVKHQNVLYAGTTSGLYYLADPATGSFRHIPDITINCWSLLATGDSLLAATTHGVFQVDAKNKRAVKIAGSNSNYLLLSRFNKNRVYVGRREGLISLYRAKEGQERWMIESQFEGITENIITIAEDKRGGLWLGTLTDGVLKVDCPFDLNETASGKPGNLTPKVIRYNTMHGIATGEVHVFTIAGHVVFTTRNGIFRYNDQTGKFIPDNRLGKEFAGTEKGRGMFRMVEDQDKNIWFHSELRNFRAIPDSNKSYSITRKDFLRLPLSQVNAIYPDPNGRIVWFASNYGLVRFDKTVKKNYDQNFTTAIRQVAINGVPRIFFPDGHICSEIHNKQRGIPVFSYSERNLRFQFAALFFEGESETRYQCFLKGYDDDWSDWTQKINADYTNLGAGTYTFNVRAKNIYENVGREAQFQFKVLPPWYSAWWAYLLYAAAAIFGIFLLFKWRSRKLVQEKVRLENIVHERTREVEHKNRQLEEQSEKLKEMDKIKSRFFANISHEFRTPITLILGPLEQMIDNCPESEEETKRKLTLMLRNGQRLLRLINQLLELSKLDSGKLKLQVERTNISTFLKGITDSFRVLARQRELDLVFAPGPETEDILLCIDTRKMEDIMSNLLINALKFTPPGGKITITLNKSFCGGPGGPSPTGFIGPRAAGKNAPLEGSVEISVSDTGPGIPPDQLPYIFDRFYQADSTYEYHQKGSGIGLALTKELVELHHGTIDIMSRQGEGSTFIIRIPMGDTHLSPGERETHAASQNHIPIDEVFSEISAAPENGNHSSSGTTGGPVMPNGSPGIILVVEDSADMREYIKGALEPAYTVEEARDGKDGIEKALEIIPDLIISDIMMPGTDGYEMCRVLKNDIRTSHVPIIMLTAKASEESILQGLETGADDYITKPFNTKILTARIRNLIDIRSQLQANINREMTLQPVKTAVSNIDRVFLEELHKTINKNLSDEDFNVEQLCKKLYMSRTTLYRKVLAVTGLTPTDYIRSYRLKRAAQLLKQNHGTVLEVAVEAGFANSSYFAKCFKEKFHQLPSEYQETNRK